MRIYRIYLYFRFNKQKQFMNKKERIQLIKSITTTGTVMNVGEFGQQPVSRISPFNCYLMPNTCKTGSDNRYAWTSIHDLLKDKSISYVDQHLQAKIEVSFSRLK